MYPIKPGFLVSVKTEVVGGCQYLRQDVRKEHTEEGGVEQQWVTTKRIIDEAEYDKAGKVRSRARSEIARRCLETPFGLVCREDRIEELRQAIKLAQLLAQEFNLEARYSQISINVLMGRIASDDVEAAERIAEEMRNLAAEITQAVKSADVKAIRKASDQAKAMGQMLDEAQQIKVNDAVKAAKAAATRINKDVIKANKDLEAILPKLDLSPINTMRLAFLDVEDGAECEKAELPKGDLQRAAAIELEEEVEEVA